MISVQRILDIAAAIAVTFVLAACSDPSIVESSQAVESPGGVFVATIETVDNGLGFGLGREYEEVHLTRRGAEIHRHGDSEPTVVFYVEAAERPYMPLSVRWRGPRELEIAYDSPASPGRKLASWGEVSLTYKAEASSQ
jgi:hypothetical protein